MLRTVLDLLVPPRCLACGAAARDTLCAACRSALPWLRDACPRCALPRPCAPCSAARQGFDRAWAAVAHEGPARALVHALKFRGHLAAADVMAAQMAATLRRAPPSQAPDHPRRVAPLPPSAGPLPPEAPLAATLVPVPPAPARLRRRGFDPADLLARRLAARTGLELAACLRREGEGRQLGARRAERLRAGAKGEVVASGRAPPVALLVDDVHTTGATLDACAIALASVGTRTILAVTYARTVRRA